MKQIIELEVPNTLRLQGVKGIFYEGPIISVSYKNSLITFKVHKDDQSRTLQRIDKVVDDTIDTQTTEEIKHCIAANWELILTSRTSVPLRELDRESLELNRQKHLDRLYKLYGPSSNPLPANKKNSYSSVFATYVTIEENNSEELN